MFSINTKRHRWWQQLIFLQCLPRADRGSKCITHIILYTSPASMGQVLLLWLYQAWSADPTLRKTNLLPPGCDGGKDVAVIAGPSKENGQLTLKRSDTPVALGTFFPGNGEGEDLSLPDLLLDILIGWKWGNRVVFGSQPQPSGPNQSGVCLPAGG